MKKWILIIGLAAGSFGCGLKDEILALDAIGDEGKKTWVFAQFNVPKEGDVIDTYYYYGKVSQKLYGLLTSNGINSGFILLEDVKYWGDDDLIYDYSDGESDGDLVFRVEDIRTIKRVNKTPRVGLGFEQFESTEPKSAVQSE